MAFDPMQEEPDEGEGWLVSYADMMTLIACFFILMMAFAHFEPIGFSVKAEQLSKAFRKEKYKSADMKLKEITEEVAKHEVKDATKITIKDSELVVTFSSSTLFDNGVATLSSNAEVMLDSLIDVIKLTNPNYRVLIEGHSDDDLAQSQYQTPWALSVARAAYVASRFELFGFPKDKIVPIGRGESWPVVESKNSKGQRVEAQAKINRRVVIRLLEPVEKKKVKFGLGIYFKDAFTNVKEEDLQKSKDEGQYDVQTK